MMRRLTRRRRQQLKKRGKHSRSKRSHSRNKTRRGKYIKKRRGVTRRRVLRGGKLKLMMYQKVLMNSFFDSLNIEKDFDKALFYLDALYSSLGERFFIDMLGSREFKREYENTFYDEKCFAKLRLIQFLSYIYANVSNGNTITQDGRILHFTPGRFKKVDRLKSSGRFKSSSAVKDTSEGSVIWMLLALLCGADAQCLNTTSYVADDFKSGEGRKLLGDIYENLTKLSSSDYLDKKTQQYIRTVILKSMVIDENINKLGFNTTILCSILKRMLHIDEDEIEEEEEAVAEATAAVAEEAEKMEEE